MSSMFLIAAALATLLTAFTHSYFGEKMLIAPLVESDDGVALVGRCLQRLVF